MAIWEDLRAKTVSKSSLLLRVSFLAHLLAKSVHEDVKKVPGASRNAFFKRLTTNKIQSTEHQKIWFYLSVLIILEISKATLSARIGRFAGHLCKLGWCLGRFWVLCVVACFVMSAILGIFISRATLACHRAISWRLLAFMLACFVGSVRLSLNLWFQERFWGSINVCLLWGFCPRFFY